MQSDRSFKDRRLPVPDADAGDIDGRAAVNDSRSQTTAGVQVFLNPRSGSADGDLDRVQRLFKERGVEAKITELDRASDCASLVRQAVQAGAQIVVAGGGDGTINAIASALIGKHVALGVLPLGTLNHFARDLKIPSTIEGAIDVIAGRNIVSVDVGDVNGHIFLNNSGLGLYPSVVIQREQLKKLGLNKWVSLSFAAIRAFIRLPRLDISLTEGGRAVHLDTPFVFVGNNRYELQGARLGERRSLTGAHLFLSIAPGIGRLGLLRICLAALGSSLKKSDCFEYRSVQDFSIQSRHRHSKVSIDGEVRRMGNPLHYRSMPGSLRVCVPAVADDEARMAGK